MPVSCFLPDGAHLQRRATPFERCGWSAPLFFCRPRQDIRKLLRWALTHVPGDCWPTPTASCCGKARRRGRPPAGVARENRAMERFRRTRRDEALELPPLPFLSWRDGARPATPCPISTARPSAARTRSAWPGAAGGESRGGKRWIFPVTPINLTRLPTIRSGRASIASGRRSEGQQPKAVYVIYSQITPFMKLAEHGPTVSAPAMQASGMGVNRVAQAVLGECICRDWHDHSWVDR